MTRPSHVRSIDDYLYWVLDTIDRLGGELRPPVLDPEVFHDEETGEEIEALIGRCAIVLPGAYEITFDLLIDRNLTLLEYHYILRPDGQTPVCRIDKHEQPHVDGLTHVHWPDGRGGETTETAPEYDFDEAIDYLLRVRAEAVADS